VSRTLKFDGLFLELLFLMMGMGNREMGMTLTRLDGYGWFILKIRIVLMGVYMCVHEFIEQGDSDHF
jgi:hypothetical protein